MPTTSGFKDDEKAKKKDFILNKISRSNKISSHRKTIKVIKLESEEKLYLNVIKYALLIQNGYIIVIKKVNNF